MELKTVPTSPGPATRAKLPARSGRFAPNLAANLAQLGLTLVVGVWYVPFLVRHLGADVYGLIPLTSTVTSYMALITLGLDSAVARYLTIALEREDQRQANLIFNVSLWSNLALSAALVVPAAVAVSQVEHLLRIPAGYEIPARWLFAGVLAALLLNQIKTPFSVSAFCRNRLDLQNLVTIGETLTRVGLVVGLFWLFRPRIEFVGAAILAGSVVSAGGKIWLWRRLTPALRIRLRDFDWSMTRRLMGTGGWVVVSQVGAMLYLNIDLLVANRLLGAEPAGRYAAVLQLPLLLRSLSAAVGGIFAPTMLHLYAHGDQAALTAYLKHSIKFQGLVLALPIGLICGFAEPLLRLWLGPEFGQFAPLLCLLTVPLCVNLAMYPLYALPLATNRVKVPGLVTLAIGLCNLALALVSVGIWHWGLYGLAAAGALMLTVRHLLFTPLYAAHILGRSVGTFFGPLLPVVLATLAAAGLGRLISWEWALSGWPALGAAGIAVSLAFVVVVLALLPRSERAALEQALRALRKPAS